MSVFKAPTFYLFTTCVLSAIAFSTVSSFAVSYTAGSIPGAALLGWLITLCAAALALVIVSSWLIHQRRSKQPSTQNQAFINGWRGKQGEHKRRTGVHSVHDTKTTDINSKETQSLLADMNKSEQNIRRGLETGRRRLVIGLAAITITVSLYLLASGLATLLLDPTQFGTALKFLTNTSVTTITSIVFTFVLIYAIGSIMQNLFITPVKQGLIKTMQQNSADSTNSFEPTGHRLGSGELETSTEEASKQLEEQKRLRAEEQRRALLTAAEKRKTANNPS